MKIKSAEDWASEMFENPDDKGTVITDIKAIHRVQLDTIQATMEYAAHIAENAAYKGGYQWASKHIQNASLNPEAILKEMMK